MVGGLRDLVMGIADGGLHCFSCVNESCWDGGFDRFRF